MAEWRKRTLDLPEGLQDAITSAASVTATVADFLGAVAAALDVVKTFAQANLDLYVTLVNAFIDQVQNFLEDTKNAGVYVLVDYPQNINVALFNPLSYSNLAGTLVDTRDPRVITSDDDPLIKASGLKESRLQAIARHRKSWNPPSTDFLSYHAAVERIVQAFSDVEDPLRPQFSESAVTVGVVVMVHSTEVLTFLKLVRSLANIFAIEELNQLQAPSVGKFVEGFNKPLADFSKKDLEGIDLCIPFNLRGGGRHPNFILNTKLGDLIPVLGDILTLLSELVENLRPNGDITKFIQDIIDAFEAKIERLREIADLLKELSDQLANGFQGSAFSTLVVKSSTGDNGFKLGLLNSTGHPEFDQALVCSVLLYAGGPATKALEALFSSAGDTIVDSNKAALERAKTHLDRPLLAG